MRHQQVKVAKRQLQSVPKGLWRGRRPLQDARLEEVSTSLVLVEERCKGRHEHPFVDIHTARVVRLYAAPRARKPVLYQRENQ